MPFLYVAANFYSTSTGYYSKQKTTCFSHFLWLVKKYGQLMYGNSFMAFLLTIGKYQLLFAERLLVVSVKSSTHVLKAYGQGQEALLENSKLDLASRSKCICKEAMSYYCVSINFAVVHKVIQYKEGREDAFKIPSSRKPLDGGTQQVITRYL